jgi:hypothetical protein
MCVGACAHVLTFRQGVASASRPSPLKYSALLQVDNLAEVSAVVERVLFIRSDPGALKLRASNC